MGRLRTQGTAGLWRRSSKEQSQASDQDLLPPAIILFAALPIRLKPAAWRGAAACRETPELSAELRVQALTLRLSHPTLSHIAARRSGKTAGHMSAFLAAVTDDDPTHVAVSRSAAPIAASRCKYRTPSHSLCNRRRPTRLPLPLHISRPALVHRHHRRPYRFPPVSMGPRTASQLHRLNVHAHPHTTCAPSPSRRIRARHTRHTLTYPAASSSPAVLIPLRETDTAPPKCTPGGAAD